jgi:hypothetical protein
MAKYTKRELQAIKPLTWLTVSWLDSDPTSVLLLAPIPREKGEVSLYCYHPSTGDCNHMVVHTQVVGVHDRVQPPAPCVLATAVDPRQRPSVAAETFVVRLVQEDAFLAEGSLITATDIVSLEWSRLKSKATELTKAQLDVVTEYLDSGTCPEYRVYSSSVLGVQLYTIFHIEKATYLRNLYGFIGNKFNAYRCDLKTANAIVARSPDSEMLRIDPYDETPTPEPTKETPVLSNFKFTSDIPTYYRSGASLHVVTQLASAFLHHPEDFAMVPFQKLELMQAFNTGAPNNFVGIKVGRKSAILATAGTNPANGQCTFQKVKFELDTGVIPLDLNILTSVSLPSKE